MAVKKGYKQTEVGVIPEDWYTSPLGECGVVVMGQSPPGSTYNRNEQGVALINGPTEFTNKYPTKIQWTSAPARFCRVFDLLICVRGSSTGRTNLADDNYAIGRGVAAIRASSNNSTFYLSSQVVSAVKAILASTTGSTFPSIDGNSLRKILIHLPPTLREQEAIAGALSDADTWIESLEQLIAKKRQIKQGAMQELLTGKRRLPGFSGKWETKRLGDHCRFLRNGTNSRADLSVDGPLRYLHYGDIHSCNNVYLSPNLLPSLPMSKAYTLDRLQDGDLVLADASEDTIGISKSVEILGVDSFELVAGLHTIAVRFSVGIFAPRFVGLLQHCPDFNSHLRKLAAGTKVYATNRRHVSSAEVSIPGLTEQTAIATVLSDMDTEIESLESKLAKAREIKQGMMQELLTGRIRLIEN